MISNYPSNPSSYSKMNHAWQKKAAIISPIPSEFRNLSTISSRSIYLEDSCFFSWRQSLIGVLPGRWQVDDTRAEKNRRGGGKDGIRNGLCGCRWTTVLIAPPNASKRPQMLSSRGIETFVQTALFYPPLLRDLPSLSLLLIRDRQLKKGPG